MFGRKDVFPAVAVIQEFLDLRDRKRLGEQVSLAVFAAQDPELMKLVDTLDSLGNYF